MLLFGSSSFRRSGPRMQRSPFTIYHWPLRRYHCPAVTRKIVMALALVLGCAGALVAQRYGGRGRGGGWGWGGGEGISENSPIRTAREAQRHSNADFPSWTNAPGFEKDVW